MKTKISRLQPTCLTVYLAELHNILKNLNLSDKMRIHLCIKYSPQHAHVFN